MENPFEVKVYDRNFNFKGYIGNPISLTVTPRFNDTGTATVEIDMTHRLVPAVLEDGSRLVISKDGQFILSGRIFQKSSQGPSATATLNLFVRSDFQLLKQVIGWPDPLSALSTQTDTSKTMIVSGAAETILKGLVQKNMITRLGMPVTLAADSGRGNVIPATEPIEIRFQPLYEKLFPVLEKTGGIGVTFEQHGSSIVCDVFIPPVYKFTLTEDSGVLQWWSWSSSEAGATRVVVAGKSDTANNVTTAPLIQVTDPDLELGYHGVIEAFDSDSDADDSTKLAASAQKYLDANASKSGFAVRLAETDTFRYGHDGLVVGAQITISVGGVTRTDYLREVTLSYTRDGGVQVTPVVGEIQDSPDRIVAKFLARIVKSINELKVRK